MGDQLSCLPIVTSWGARSRSLRLFKNRLQISTTGGGGGGGGARSKSAVWVVARPDCTYLGLAWCCTYYYRCCPTCSGGRDGPQLSCRCCFGRTCLPVKIGLGESVRVRVCVSTWGGGRWRENNCRGKHLIVIFIRLGQITRMLNFLIFDSPSLVRKRCFSFPFARPFLI